MARVRDKFAIKDMGHGQSGTSICVWAAGGASALKGHRSRLSTPVRKCRGFSKSPVKLQLAVPLSTVPTSMVSLHIKSRRLSETEH